MTRDMHQHESLTCLTTLMVMYGMKAMILVISLSCDAETEVGSIFFHTPYCLRGYYRRHSHTSALSAIGRFRRTLHYEKDGSL